MNDDRDRDRRTSWDAGGGSSYALVPTTSASSSLDESKCNSLKFKDICNLFEAIKKADNKKDKLELVFHKELKKNIGSDGSLFPLLRVLLPSIDEDRASYGLKEASIAKLYVDKLALVLDKHSAGYELINWKKGGGDGEEKVRR